MQNKIQQQTDRQEQIHKIQAGKNQYNPPFLMSGVPGATPRQEQKDAIFLDESG